MVALRLNNSITETAHDMFSKMFPVFGERGNNLPVWNEGQKMFIVDQHESDSGNRYYKGIRFSNQVAIVEKVGLFHCFTYIDSIELYVFNGKKAVLAAKRIYSNTYYDAAFIKNEILQMVSDYMEGQLRIQDATASRQLIDTMAKDIVEKSYSSFIEADSSKLLKEMVEILCVS